MFRRVRRSQLLAVLVALVVPLALFTHAAAAAGPGEGSGGKAAVSAAASANSLTEFKTIVGQVVLSEDACGTNTSSCTVDIVKPSPLAVVREADLFCATTGGSGYRPQNGDVTVNGSPVAWDEIIPNSISSFNARDDVTAMVKPAADAASAGLVTFTITEDPTFSYDGCALKVIWDDPTTTTNSILIFWGAQETTGDTFVINFAPLDASAFLAPMEFSLGISFGFQPGAQFSQVDVNAMRLTTSAGGQDDGQGANGALITLGGTGDTAANPPPFAPPASASVPDDELYDLRPFVSPGDTSMTIFTLNPSNDDNIFLANLFLRNVRVVPPEPVPTTLTLTPPTATNVAGEEHCVTATVTDQFGNPVPGVPVAFAVSGANSAGGTVVTNGAGQAVFCYTGTVAGNDAITATTQDGSNLTATAAKTYVAGPPATLTLSPPTATNVVDTQHCVTATVRDQFGNPVPGATVNFSTAGSTSASGTGTTDAGGQAGFCYTGPALPGSDVITATAAGGTNPTATAAKNWVIPPSTPGCKVTYGGRITAANGDKATFGGNAHADRLKGQQEYQDHGPAADLNVYSIDVRAVTCSPDGKAASIFGTATVNGGGRLDYRIDLKDLGEPGRNDTYRIRLSNGYDSGEQVLVGGNVQIHK